MQIASFRVGDQEYAFDIMSIKEIVNPVPITPVPKTPPFIEGIIELRGAVLPVVDLRKRFEVEAGEHTRETKYIVVAIEGQIVGLVVDRVREVMRIEAGEVLEPPTAALGADARFIAGVIKRDGGMIMLLDVREILSASEKSLLADMGQSAT